jgi:hypothetical protein
MLEGMSNPQVEDFFNLFTVWEYHNKNKSAIESMITSLI